MNKVILIGRLTKDPDVKVTQGGLSIARYTLAVDRYKKDEADFINCVAFDKKADFAEKYLAKGTKIAIVGRIQTGSYTNREGQKVYTTDIIIDEQEFAEKRTETGREEPREQKEEKQDMSGFAELPDDFAGLPFA